MEIKMRDSIDDGVCGREGEFHCDNTYICVSIDAVCDGVVQCGYGTDENQCSSLRCTGEYFQCSISLQCLLGEQVCDGKEHCLLGDDEINCVNETIYLTKGNSMYNLTSPNYPSNYETNTVCKWSIQSDNANGFIQINILDFDTETRYDKVTIFSQGLILGDISTTSTDVIHTETGEELVISGPTKLTSILTSGDEAYIEFTSNYATTRHGFKMEIKMRDSIDDGVCGREGEFHCDNTYVCIAVDAVCDGFVQCGYGTDENKCSSVSCPEYFQCSRSLQCLLWEQVCDGKEQCLLKDDEINCDKNRCPVECDCWYEEGDLYVACQTGWTKETLDNMAATTDVLQLSGRNMSKLEPGNFKRFFRLHTLYLTNNSIEEIAPLSFEGLSRLSWLNISQNDLSVLQQDTFKELINLHGIVIQDVPLKEIQEAAFRGLDQLTTIVLMRGKFGRDNPITVQPGAIQNLAKLRTLYVDDHRLCCKFKILQSFDTDRCYTTQQQSPLFNCGSLMQNTFLRVSMWILGLSALIGNIAVVAWRCRIAMTQSLGHGTKYVHNFLVLNLAISDLLMGVYMVTIATADIHYGDQYYDVSTSWRLGRVCKFAGIVSVLSSEASVFFVTLISLDRFFCIVYPLGMIHLTRFTARIAVATIWIVGFILSSLPTILADADSDIYGLSDVCIGLPLITKPASYDLQEGRLDYGRQSFKIPVPKGLKPAWTYSIILFLGVNLVCFLIITIAYTAIFFKFRASHHMMKESRVNMTGKEEMNMALRMAVIVGTDLMCWMPVIIMGILSQTGAITIPPFMYAWTVVFILPINSSINPYLYTIFSLVSDRRSKGKATSVKVSCFSKCCKKTTTEATYNACCTCENVCPTCETRL
ncbi:uncharacterized protein [Asterias amurensis]|uniref:uncharacterized protein n=1 Tax=Asterias amurensis TaxID=7602 RepID=UPI003AB5451A